MLPLRTISEPRLIGPTHFAFHSADRSIHFFVQNQSGVCALLQTRVFLPGVREALEKASRALE